MSQWGCGGILGREQEANIVLGKAREAAGNAMFAGWATRPAYGEWHLQVRELAGEQPVAAYQKWVLAVDDLGHAMSAVSRRASGRIALVHQKQAEVKWLYDEWLRKAEALLASLIPHESPDGDAS